MTFEEIKKDLKNLMSGAWLGTSDLSRISTILFWAIVIACIFVVAGTDALLWGFAALMSGMLLGFLFGIPRVQQMPLDSQDHDVTEPSGRTNNNGYSQRVNTNLEEISDWLTKIIVGVGLVELNHIPPAFESLVMFLTPKDGDPGTTGTVLVLFSIVGFFDGYLLTRVYLAAAFSRADRLASQFDQELSELRKQVDRELPEVVHSESEEVVEVKQLSKEFPRGAVLEAWLVVESVVDEALRKKSIEPDKSGIKKFQQLEEHQILPSSQLASLHQLRQLRNIAVHDAENRISTREAEEYIDLANRIALLLRND